jgi:hypothetical protein
LGSDEKVVMAQSLGNCGRKALDGLQRFADECSWSDTRQLLVELAKVRPPQRG